MTDLKALRITFVAFILVVGLAIGLLAYIQNSVDESKPSADSYESLLMDFSWMTLSGHQQNALCKQWREGTEAEFSALLDSAGTDMMADDEWFAMLERHC